MTHFFKIVAEINISCYSEGGIEDIKRAIKAGLSIVDENDNITFQLVSSPKYLLSLVDKNADRAIKILNNVINKIKEHIENVGGTLSIVSSPLPIEK